MNNQYVFEALKKESGISEEVVVAANVKHIDSDKANEVVSLRKSGIAFPYFDFNGNYKMSRLRKDEVAEGEGRYHQKSGSKRMPYFLRENTEAILNPNVPLIILEGEKKLLSLYSHLFYEKKNYSALIAGAGSYGLLFKNDEGEQELSKEFKMVPLKNRLVYLIPDSDYFFNPDVTRAYDKLIDLMVSEEANVGLIDIRGETEEKLGVDDFIVKHGINKLLERMENPVAVFEQNEEQVSFEINNVEKRESKKEDAFKTVEGELVQFPEMTGFMKVLYDWILATSPVKQPVLAYGSVIAIIATALSHLYRFNNAYPVFYQMFVARSGSGKDRPLKVSKIIFGHEPLENYLGLSSYRSDASIIDTLPEQRARLDILDEVDAVLKISNSTNGYQSGIINILTELWSECDKYFVGRRSKTEGHYGNCWNPCVNIISALTPTAFRENFTKSMMLTGFGGRFLYYISYDNFEYTDNFVGTDMNEVPKNILEPLKHWHSLKKYDDEKKRFNVTNLSIADDARDLLNNLRRKYYDKAMTMDEENSLSPVIQRQYENLERLLIVHTCSQEPYNPSPIIQVSNVTWCRAFLEALYQNNEFFLKNNVAATPFEHLKAKILNHIAKAGKRGKLHSKLLKDSHIPAKQLADIVKTLIESEQIKELTVKKARIYFYVDKK